MENLPINGNPSSLFDPEIENATEERKGDTFKIFREELRKMLFGFGDVKKPLEETLDLLSDMVIQYITAVAKYGQSLDPKNKLSLDAIHYMIQHDPLKFQSVQELLAAQQDLKDAKKHFEVPN